MALLENVNEGFAIIQISGVNIYPGGGGGNEHSIIIKSMQNVKL
jgi:hypothetical protein